MKTLVIYDSEFGNTKIIAQRIAEELSLTNDVRLVNAVEAKPEDLQNIDFLIIGSPTQGGRPRQVLQDFINQIPSNSLKNVKTAVFDTRIPEGKNFALRLLLRTIGYAAPKIMGALINKGAVYASQPIGFCVKDREGPLLDGEETRAREWAQTLHDH